MYIAENVENKLWNMYPLPYTHAKKPIFKPMTGGVSKGKGTKKFSKRNINEKKKDSTVIASGSIKLRNVDNVTKLHCVSDDLDNEDNLPLIHVKEGLKDISQGNSPIGLRTRKCLHEKKIVLCEKQGEMLYLKYYERVSGKMNKKLISIDRKNVKSQNLLKKRHAMNKC